MLYIYIYYIYYIYIYIHHFLNNNNGIINFFNLDPSAKFLYLLLYIILLK